MIYKLSTAKKVKVSLLLIISIGLINNFCIDFSLVGKHSG